MIDKTDKSNIYGGALKSLVVVGCSCGARGGGVWWEGWRCVVGGLRCVVRRVEGCGRGRGVWWEYTLTRGHFVSVY